MSMQETFSRGEDGHRVIAQSNPLIGSAAPKKSPLQWTPPRYYAAIIMSARLVLLHHDKDHKIVTDWVLPHLQGLPVWHRGDLRGGDSRMALRQRVHEAGLVLAVVSADLLADLELADLLSLALSRQKNGRCVLLPVRARPCEVRDQDLAELAFVRLCEPTGAVADDTQHRDHALSNRRDPDAAGVRVGQAVLERWARDVPQHAAPPPPPATEAPLLMLHIGRAADGTVQISYASAQAGVTHRVVASARAIDEARTGGETLFQLLFPAGHVAPLAALRPGTPNPLSGAMRVRVLPGDPALAALPWQSVAFAGVRLSNWTFVCTRVDPPTTPVVLRLPCRVAAFGADPSAADSLRAVLRRATPEHRTCEEPLALLTTPVALPGGVPLLFVQGSASMLGPAVLAALAAPPVTLLVVYLCGAGWESAAFHLAERVPLVLCGEDRAAAFTFLGELLEHRRDPAIAQQVIAAMGLAPPVLYQRPESFTIHAVVASRRDRFAHLRLDRDAQRAMAQKHVQELLRSGSRRVEALVAYAEPGNYLERFPMQALAFIETQQLQPLLYRRYELPLPVVEGAHFRQALLPELREHLGAAPDESTEALLRRKAERGMQLLFLDYGHHTASSLDLEELELLMQFANAELCVHCPRDLRIVCYVGLELPVEKHQDLVDTMSECAAELFHDHFRCMLLEPALGHVKRTDLLNFLSDPDNCSCPPHDVKAAATAVFAKTQGRYDETLQILKQAEQITWPELLRCLAGGGRKPRSWKDRNE